MGRSTYQELECDFDKARALLEKHALYFESDMMAGAGFSPLASITLADRQNKWRGYGLGLKGTFRLVEGEYVKAEEYDALPILGAGTRHTDGPVSRRRSSRGGSFSTSLAQPSQEPDLNAVQRSKGARRQGGRLASDSNHDLW